MIPALTCPGHTVVIPVPGTALRGGFSGGIGAAVPGSPSSSRQKDGLCLCPASNQISTGACPGQTSSRAIELANQLDEIQRGDPATLYYRGLAYEKTGQWKEALADLNQARSGYDGRGRQCPPWMWRSSAPTGGRKLSRGLSCTGDLPPPWRPAKPVVLPRHSHLLPARTTGDAFVSTLAEALTLFPMILTSWRCS